MKTGYVPENFADLLVLARKADCLSFFRGSQTLSLMLDDIPGDRRSCIEMRLDRLTADVRTLNGYDKATNKWGEYCSPQGSLAFPDKRGLKALRDYIAELATSEKGFPNPEFLSVYRKQPAAAAEFALVA